MLPFYFDDDTVNSKLVRAARKHGIKVVIPADCGMVGADDEPHLDYAAAHALVLLTDNRQDLKLGNPFDEAFVRVGRRKSVRSCTVDAMIDSGSVRSCIPPAIARKLGITIRGHEIAELADGKTKSVERTDALIFDILGRNCSDDTLVLGNEVLIGQTVLEKLDFLVDCKRRKLVPGHPGKAVNKVK